MTRMIFVAAALALAATLPAVPAQAAGAPRTFLSAAGSDANSCTNVATPCRHMAAAFAATAPDGEIYVLDPANYGSLNITHGVSIEGHGWASIAPVNGGAAININANPGDKINIVGVVLDGTALPGTNGIDFNSGGSLNVRDSVIRNFLSGIRFEPTASTPSQFFMSNTLVSDNGQGGIGIAPSGSGTVRAVLNHVEMENNGGNGLDVSAGGQTINVTVSDSVSANNGANGINVTAAAPAGIVFAMVRNSTIANNTTNGLLSNNTGADCLGIGNPTIRVSRSTITGNATGWLEMGCGQLYSATDNNIDGNGTANTAPPNVLPYK
jgi:hypothetical protein